MTQRQYWRGLSSFHRGKGCISSPTAPKQPPLEPSFTHSFPNVRAALFIGFAGLSAAFLVAAARANRPAIEESDTAPPSWFDGAGWPSLPDPFALITEMTGQTETTTARAKLSPAGLDAIKAREGFSAKPYPDHKGYSIGYGHLMGVFDRRESITKEEAEALLLSDVAWAEDAVNDAITAPLTQSQFDALVSLAFNIGGPAFKRSTLVKRINAGDPGAASEFARWNIASGKVNPALVARRAAEAEQFGSA